MIYNLLRRMSVRRRIVGSFLILLIFLTLFIPLTITDHLSLTGRVEQLVNVNARSNQLLLSALADTLSSRVNLMRYADDLTPSTSEALSDVSRAMSSIEEARSLVTEPEQKSAMANILAGLVSYSTLISNVQTARIENRQQDVTTLLSNAYRLEFDLEQQIRTVVDANVSLVNETNKSTLTTAQQRLILLVAGFIVTLLFAIAIAILVPQSITRPVAELRQGAEAFRQERRVTSIPSEGTDELSLLAQTFNQITSELSQTLTGLEQRVSERTKALATSTEVSRRLSTILDQRQLVREVVEQVQNAFHYYHAQIYLVDESSGDLVMAGGTGEAGGQMLARGHKVPKGRGLVGRAAETNAPVLVANTAEDPNWLPNPLLPETKSEVAIPIALGQNVVGVLDVQQNVAEGLKEDDVDALQSIANQVAIGLNIINQYEETQRTAEQLSNALRIARLGNWEYDFEKDLFTFTDEFYAIFRTTAEQVGGYKLTSADYARYFVHPEDAPLVGVEIQKALQSQERRFNAALEHRAIFPDGEVGYMSVRVTVERDETGKITRWYGANQDITERKRLEEQNRVRASQQEAINLIAQKIQSAATVESALQIAARELGRALGMKPTLVTLQPKELVDGQTGPRNG